MENKLTLVKYRDAGMHTYTYFWIDEEERIASPYFNSENEAQEWITNRGSSKIEIIGDCY